jgi:quinohemoprotein ethanol dehydrogenase
MLDTTSQVPCTLVYQVSGMSIFWTQTKAASRARLEQVIAIMWGYRVFTVVGLALQGIAATLASGGQVFAAVEPAAGKVTQDRVLAEAPGENWLVKGGSFAQQQFSPLKDINDKTVARLGLAWIAEMDDPMGLAAEPIVVDGVIYVSAPRSVVRAIDAASGRILWTFDPHVRLDYSMGNSSVSRVNRGVAVWSGKVYVGTGDGRLVAIDAARGTQLWSTQVVDPALNGISGAPRVAAGKVFIGHSGSDEQVRGSIAAYDAETGKQAWVFWTVPGNPALGFESRALERAAQTWSGPEWWRQGGGAVWDPITYDARTGLLLFGTSKAFRGDGQDGQESGGGAKLFSGSIVAVHADTGEYAWHYQTSTPQRQTENFHILLADLSIDGRQRHVAMSSARNGTFYVLDAGTGELISQQPLVKQEWTGPRMDYPGIVVNGVEDCKGNCFGVRNWWPMSYNPTTELTYIPIMDRRRSPAPDPKALPMVGRLVAWDPKKQTTRWSVEYPLIINGSVLSTAGNLVFEGQGSGEFAAYAADSGKKLWSAQTGSAVNGVPVSFKLHGEQYVIVPVGWGGAFRLWSPSTMMVTSASKYGPARLLAFKLGGQQPFPLPHIQIPAVPRPPEQTFTPEQVKRGTALADSFNCTDCHSPGFDGAGRWAINGGIPDLRYMPAEAHREWYAIVLGGSHREQGMMPFGVPSKVPAMRALSKAEADDIHAYVIDRAWAAYKEQQSTAAGSGAH